MSAPHTFAAARRLVWPRALAWLWAAGALAAGAAAAAALVQDISHWEAVRSTAQALKWHTVASVACCVGLLVLSKPRGDAQWAPWASATQMWVLGGLLAALVQQVGALPQWLAHSAAVAQSLGVASLWLVQLLCALRTAWVLRRSAPNPAV